MWETLLKLELQPRFDLRFFRFGDLGGFYPGPDNCYRTEFLQLVEQPFDLIVVYSHMAWGEVELFVRLRAECGKPVIACSELLYSNTESSAALKAAGVSVLPCPHSIEQFREALNACLETEQKTASLAKVSEPSSATESRKTKLLRIVILDDEEGPRMAYPFFLKDWFEGVKVQTFGDSNAAWQELSRSDPDLFITDFRHDGISCAEMLKRLAERKVRYPIMVISAMETVTIENQLRRCAGPNLNVSIMTKPILAELFRTAVEAALGIPARRAP